MQITPERQPSILLRPRAAHTHHTPCTPLVIPWCSLLLCAPTLMIFSGNFSARSSMEVPPSLQAMMMGPAGAPTRQHTRSGAVEQANDAPHGFSGRKTLVTAAANDTPRPAMHRTACKYSAASPPTRQNKAE